MTGFAQGSVLISLILSIAAVLALSAAVPESPRLNRPATPAMVSALA